MMTLEFKALSEVGRMLGWREREIEFQGSTLEDLLMSLTALDGKSLYKLLVAEGRLRPGYILSVNGRAVTSLDTHLDFGDRVMIMDRVRLFQGG